MKSAPQHPDELAGLLSSLIDQRGDESEWRLGKIIAADVTARAAYRKYVQLHAMLEWHYRPAPLSNQLPKSAAAFLERVQVASAGLPSEDKSILTRPNRWWSAGRFHAEEQGQKRSGAAARVFAIAVSLALVGYFLSVAGLLIWDRVTRGSVDEQYAQADSEQPAQLVSAKDCRLADGSLAVVGEALSHKRLLQIESGLAEVRFGRGAWVVLEGPAEFEVRSSNSAFLNHGKIFAKVPQPAVGFTVETPSAKIIDLGTEFGVYVLSDGTAEVAVKTGKIDVVPNRDQAGSRKSRRLVAGEGIRVSKTEGNITPLANAEIRLVESIGARVTSQAPSDEFQVLAWYRCGEDDSAAAADDSAPTTFANKTAVIQKPLVVDGSAWYTKDAAPHESRCALRFDPDRGSKLARVREFPVVTDNWLLEAWVNTDSPQARSTVAHVGDASQNGFGLYLVGGMWGGHFAGNTFHGATKCEAGKWTHLALLRENGRCCFFVNGLQTGPTGIQELKAPAALFTVGGFVDPATEKVSETFSGLIDEVRLIQLRRPFHLGMLLCKPLPSE